MKRYTFIFMSTMVLFTLINGALAQMTVTDDDANVILVVNDEGSTGSISLPSAAVAPSDVTNKLYSVGGSLSWSGSPLGNFWSLTGNAGTIPGTHFIGATGTTAMEIKVNNQRVLLLEGGIPSSSIYGGYSGNGSISGSINGNFIGGGGADGNPNQVYEYSTVCGGRNNKAKQTLCFIGGGLSNTIEQANTDMSTISGGKNNQIDGNDINTIPGGESNSMWCQMSFIAGRHAKTMRNGTFVWGDASTDTDINDAPYDSKFIVRSSGGVWFGTNDYADVDPTRFIATSTGAYLSSFGFWTNASDRNQKSGFAPVDGEAILAKVAELPVSSWHYKAEDPLVKHIGPVAQDFHAAFGLGHDDTHLGTVDVDGVILASIQALNKKNEEKDARFAEIDRKIQEKDIEIAEIDRKINENDPRIAELAAQFADVSTRLETLERTR